MNGFVVTDTDQNLFKRLEEKLYRETNEAKDILVSIDKLFVWVWVHRFLYTNCCSLSVCLSFCIISVRMST